MINITPLYIKEYLEDVTDVKDLSTKERKRHIVDVRSIAFALTRELCNISLTGLGELYNKDHATVLHNINRFNDLKNQPYFKDEKRLYDKCMSHFLKFTKDDEHLALKKLQTLNELKREYSFKMNKLTTHYRSIISKQSKLLNKLSNNEMFLKISELPEDEYNELKDRINAFFIMNGCKSERRIKRSKKLAQ